MERKQLASEYFHRGYNCSQAVVMAFEDRIGIDKGTLAKMSVGLGGGIGRMREVCGCVSGMAMVLGLVFGNDDPSSKNDVYPMVQKACESFKNENGSIICHELLKGVSVSTGGIAEARTPEFYKKRPCGELVEQAAEIAEMIIREKQVRND